MRIKVTIDVCNPGDEVVSATLILDGALVGSVRLGQWIEQTKAQLCKKVAQEHRGPVFVGPSAGKSGQREEET